MPLVSVIVPIYKVETYIDRCIQSIQAQTHEKLDIILVDDGSPDQCSKICDRYARGDCRIQVIHKKNGGLSDARNAGIVGAKGEYLLFVDGDDYIADNLVELALSCAQKNEADIVMFDIAEVEECTGRIDCISMNLEREKAFSAREKPVLLLNTPCAWNKLYRKSFWEAEGLCFPAGRNYEDLSTMPKLLLKAERVVCLDSKPLYYYILREGSIMRSYNFEKSYQDRKAALDDVISFFKEQGEFNCFRKELEFLVLQHAYFIPSKEIVLAAPNSPYLKKFREYAFGLFPKAGKSRYVKDLMSGKDRLLLWLLDMRQYRAMRLLSALRKLADRQRT